MYIWWKSFHFIVELYFEAVRFFLNHNFCETNIPESELLPLGQWSVELRDNDLSTRAAGESMFTAYTWTINAHVPGVERVD